MLLLTSVALPLLFVIVMALVEQLGDRGALEERLIKVGWDMCLLALGVAIATTSVCRATQRLLRGAHRSPILTRRRH